MTTRSAVQSSHSQLLRRTLQIDAAFEAILGAVLIVDATPIAAFLGLDVPGVLTLLGIILLVTAAALFWIAGQEPIDRRLAAAVAILNADWVIASAVVLFVGWLPLTNEGKWAIAILADIVAIFALLQFYALWRRR